MTAFGSRARGSARPSSDLDVLILLDELESDLMVSRERRLALAILREGVSV